MRPLIAWALYWAGDVAERCGFANLYQWLMRSADRAQGAGKGPWQ